MSKRTFEDKRVSPRLDVYYYLKVIDIATGKPLGRVVDLTTGGMLLISEISFEVGSAYSARIVLTGELFNGKSLDVKFTTQWSKADVKPSNFLNGVKFVELNSENTEYIKEVVRKIGVKSEDLTE